MTKANESFKVPAPTHRAEVEHWTPKVRLDYHKSCSLIKPTEQWSGCIRYNKKGNLALDYKPDGSHDKGRDLRRISLKGVNFMRINLFGADLRFCDCTRGFFMGASLNRADLRQTNMEWACLRKCILVRARLTGTNFKMASFTNTILTKAQDIDRSKWNVLRLPTHEQIAERDEMHASIFFDKEGVEKSHEDKISEVQKSDYDVGLFKRIWLA